jgi:hypothetical protein
MVRCSNCGRHEEDTGKFCRYCGTKYQQQPDEAATTWRLAPETEVRAEHPTTSSIRQSGQPTTSPVGPAGTGQPPQQGTDAAYVPPMEYYQPLQQVPPAAPAAPITPKKVQVAVGDWLNGGWRIYSENWALMTIGSLLATVLSFCTAGILAGPLLMGLFRMAFKAMKSERPEMSDLFAWEGKFLPAVLVFYIFVALSYAISGGGSAHEFFWLVRFVVQPFLTTGIALTLPLMYERRTDLAEAINSVGHLIFSKDALMWWVVGLTFIIINTGGLFACGLGIFVTFPWLICSAAVAHSSIFGLDDPNRTQQ